MKPIKLLSLFSGIGAFERALTLAEVPYELVAYCEIDKFASKSYSLLHNVPDSMNLGDITKVDIQSLPKNIDMIVHGSPCQSFSICGKGEGGEKGAGTQSSLLWYTVDIVKAKLPKIVLWENVPNILSKKHFPVFQSYLDELEGLGYKNFYKTLNAKDYGIPQSRKRVFTISVLQSLGVNDFIFPSPQELTVKLKDILDRDVSEKYYLTEKMIDYWKKHNERERERERK